MKIDTAPQDTNLVEAAFNGEFYFALDGSTQRVYRYTHKGIFSGFSFSVGKEITSPAHITFEDHHLSVVCSDSKRSYMYTLKGVYTGESHQVELSCEWVAV